MRRNTSRKSIPKRNDSFSKKNPNQDMFWRGQPNKDPKGLKKDEVLPEVVKVEEDPKVIAEETPKEEEK